MVDRLNKTEADDAWSQDGDHEHEPTGSLGAINPSDWRTVHRWLEFNIGSKLRLAWSGEPFFDAKGRQERYAASIASEINTGGRPPSQISHWLVPALEEVAARYDCSIDEACIRLKSEPLFANRHLPDAHALRRAYYRIKDRNSVLVPLDTFCWYIVACDHLVAAMAFQYLSEKDRIAAITMLDDFCLKTTGGSAGKLQASRT